MGKALILLQVLLIKMTFLNNLLLSVKDKAKLSLSLHKQLIRD